MAGGGAPAGGESLIPGRPVAGARHGVLALAICFRGLSLGETSEREKLSQREKTLEADRRGVLEAGRPLASLRTPRRGVGRRPLTALELGSSARSAARPQPGPRPRPSSRAQGGGRKCRGARGSRRGGRRGLPPSSSPFERRCPPREEWPRSSAAVRAGVGRARAPSSRAHQPPLAIPRARRPHRRGRCREERRAG